MSLSRRSNVVVGSADRLITAPFIIVTLSAFAVFVYVGVLAPVIPLYVEGPVNGGEIGLGLNLAAFSLAAIAARAFLGTLADRFGRRLVIVGGAVLAGLAGAALGLTESLPLMLVFRGLAGIGEAAVFVGAATLIADLAPADRRAEAASYFSVAVFGGLGVGPILGEWVLDDVNFELAFGIAGLCAVAGGVIALFAPRRVVSAEAAAAGNFEPQAPEQLEGWQRYVHPEALLPGIVLACGVAGLAAFFQFIPDYARQAGLASSGGLFAMYALLSLVIRLVGAKWPERLGPRRAVTIALSTIAAGLVVFAAFPSVVGLWVGAALVGFGVAFNYPSLMALAVNRVSDGERARAVSSFTMFFEVGSAIGGLSIAAFAELVGKRVGFLGGVVACVLGIWLLRVKVVPRGAPEVAAHDRFVDSPLSAAHHA